jgi:glutamate racemase
VSNGPIGIFDSGVGGLTVAKQVRQLLPGEDLLYFADTANCPYGHRSEEEVLELSSHCTEILLEHGAKLIVVACNSASGAALSALRARFDVPFVGMVPAVKPACGVSQTGRVGVLATPLAVRTALFTDVVNKFATDCMLTIQTCPGLAEAVERGDIDGEDTTGLLTQYLRPLQAALVDVVVLGCTHYPLLRTSIEMVMGPDVQVLDSGAAVAAQVVRVLDDRGLRSTGAGWGRFGAMASGETAVLERFAKEEGLVQTESVGAR